MDISVILPIYNCKDRLERHLRGVLEWVNLVKEIIVVDSGSTDGTLELAREVLCPYGVQFIHNPPGLYQSWNAGVSAATKKYLYFSTVEDLITPDGLSRLYDVMIAHDADVVVSPPEMRNYDGTSLINSNMPSNLLAKSFQESGLEEHVFSKAETIALLCGLLPHGILGSSASNIYRTNFLKQHPFPTDFGHMGDTAWGISVSPIVKMAFTAKTCARFLMQTNHESTDPESQKNLISKLTQLVVKTLERKLTNGAEITTMKGWFDFSSQLTLHQWEWIAGLNGYNQDLIGELKKMEENVVNLKEAIITIKNLQKRIQYLEETNKKATEENIQYQGIKGAIKCIKKTFGR